MSNDEKIERLRSVLMPAILYARKDSADYIARGVAIGWWKWGIRISHVWSKP